MFLKIKELLAGLTIGKAKFLVPMGSRAPEWMEGPVANELLISLTNSLVFAPTWLAINLACPLAAVVMPEIRVKVFNFKWCWRGERKSKVRPFRSWGWEWGMHIIPDVNTNEKHGC